MKRPRRTGVSRSSICAEKELLAAVAASTDHTSVLELYRKLLASTVFSTMNLDNLSGLSDETFAKMYKSEEPSKKPSFFKLNDVSALPRLSVAVGSSLAVYRLGPHSGPVKVYDNRLTGNLAGKERRRCLYVRLNARGKCPKAELGWDTEPPKELKRVAWLSERSLVQKDASVGEVGDSAVTCFLRRLGVPRWSAATGLPAKPSSLRDLIAWMSSPAGEERVRRAVGDATVVRLVTNVAGKKFVKLAQVPNGVDLRQNSVLNLAVCVDGKMYRVNKEVDSSLLDSWTMEKDCAAAAKLLSKAVLPKTTVLPNSESAMTGVKTLRCGARVKVAGPPPPPCSCKS